MSVATLKIDGMFFFLGHVAGALFFGETVSFITTFWNSGYLGRFTLPELLHVETGVTVVLVVCLALAMFLGFGWLRSAIYGKTQ